MPKRTVLSLFAFAVAALGADPVVGTVTVKPTFAPANTPTQVTITALITDTSLSANGANVQRLNSAGNPTAVLGILHDDGLNGGCRSGRPRLHFGLHAERAHSGPHLLPDCRRFPGGGAKGFV